MTLGKLSGGHSFLSHGLGGKLVHDEVLLDNVEEETAHDIVGQRRKKYSVFSLEVDLV